MREELTAEAIRLTRLLRELLPANGEVTGMLGLMLLTEARRGARVSPSGELVPLFEQDRALWDAALISEGHALVRERLASGLAPGRYQLLAAINAVHTDGTATDWTQVVALYDQLVRLDPSPIVKLNRAIAVGECDGPAMGLALVDRLADELRRVSPVPCGPGAVARTPWPGRRSAGGIWCRERARGELRRDRVLRAASVGAPLLAGPKTSRAHVFVRAEHPRVRVWLSFAAFE